MGIRLHTPTRVELTLPLDLAQRIEHTKIQFKVHENEEEAIEALCNEALDETFRAVCVRPRHVQMARSFLEDEPLNIAVVIGLPEKQVPLTEAMNQMTWGDIPLEDKIDAIEQAIEDGADEFDVLMNVAQFLRSTESSDKPDTVYEVVKLVEAAQGRVVKIIIETDLLNTDDDISHATQAAMRGGAQFIKTSSGMLKGGAGARVHDVKLMGDLASKFNHDPKPLIKASAGIRTFQHAYDLLQNGADVLGTSMGVRLMDDYRMIVRT